MKSHKKSLFYHILETKAKSIRYWLIFKKALHYLCLKIVINNETNNSTEKYNKST
jgi:hypothetical protein